MTVPRRNENRRIWTGMAQVAPEWLETATALMKSFAEQHNVVLTATERTLSASFEIGCLHALLRSYERQKYRILPMDLEQGAFKYLTTPSGNPLNFSYVELDKAGEGSFEVRQQVRIESHIAPDIRFTPDIVVLVKGAHISSVKTANYANGKRAFFQVKSDAVVAAHECKSMNPFPELMVSFIGMLVTAHAWHPGGQGISAATHGHLAPTLFVGGTASAFHLKMIQAMQTAYVLNIVVGMHGGTWSLSHAKNRFRWLGGASPSAPAPMSTPAQSVAA